MIFHAAKLYFRPLNIYKIHKIENLGTFFSKPLRGGYIALNITSKDYSGKAIVENIDLFRYMAGKYQLKENEYISTIKNIIISTDTLVIENGLIEDLGFSKVIPIPIIEENAQKGVDKFINIYFDDRLLKTNISDIEKSFIISTLFNWSIPTRNDDLSGYLVILNH